MVVFVLYEVEGEEQSSNFSNAMELHHLSREKEIYLFDLLEYILRAQPSMHNYLTSSFYAVLEDEVICLDSPSSLVPISADGIIRLLLRPNDAGVIPHVPLTQTYQFAQKSRRQFYNASNFNKSKAFEFVSFQDKQHGTISAYSARSGPEMGQLDNYNVRSTPREQQRQSTVSDASPRSRKQFGRSSDGSSRASEASHEGNFLSDDTVKAVNEAAEVQCAVHPSHALKVSLRIHVNCSRAGCKSCCWGSCSLSFQLRIKFR